MKNTTVPFTTPTRWLRRVETANRLGISPKTLANWALLNKGPVGRKVGGKLVLYAEHDVDAYVNAHPAIGGRAA